VRAHPYALRVCHVRATGRLLEPCTGRNYLLRVQLPDGTPLRIMLNLMIGVVAAADGRDPHDLQAAFREVPWPRFVQRGRCRP